MKQSHKTGFTLIELTIAMLFVTFLMIFCVTTLVQVLRMYDKGSAIKQISQTTRLVNDELARSIRSVTTASEVRYPSSGAFDRICINNTMYIWNVLYEDNGNPRAAGVATRHQVAGRAIGFAKLKVGDAEFNKCTDSSTIINKANYLDGESEILGGSARVAQSSLETTSDGRIYSLALRIGTYTQSELSRPAADRMITPAKHGAGSEVGCQPGNDGNFCFVNQLQLTVYAANINI